MRNPTLSPPLRGRALATMTALLFAVVPLFGCGNSADTDAAADSGEVVISLTDAEGDFLRYEVDVLSIRLTKANGAVVETLPVQTRIDFAELTEMTEFVTAQRVPSGRYTSAKLTLDYTGAEILVENAAGDGVVPTLLDETGNPVDTLEMEVHLDSRRPLVIAPGVPAHLTLDFDLAATHTLEWDSGTVTVTVAPLLVAEVDPEQPKEHRVRGPLVSVDEASESFTLGIRPLRGKRHLGNRDLGRLRVATHSGTVYEVDGVAASGSEGFALLSAKSPLTAVAVIGELVPGIPRRFRANEVYAGNSVPGGELDGMTGTVMARTGEQLTVRGAVLDRDGHITFNTEVEVTLGTETILRKQGEPAAELDTAAVSVGQHITALGVYDSDQQTLDASAGYLRLLITRVTGTTVEVRSPAANGGELDLELQRLDGRRVPVAGFDFTGTGVTPADDADPSTYTLATGTLPLTGLADGDPVRVFGFPAPFGAAPPDFDAVSVVAVSQVHARLQVRWPGSSATGVAVTEDGSSLVVNLDDAGRLHHVVRAGVATELSPRPAPTIVPASDAGLFALRDGSCTVYGSFAEFSVALGRALEDGGQVVHLGATGTFDDDSQTFTARGIRVSLR